MSYSYPNVGNLKTLYSVSNTTLGATGSFSTGALDVTPYYTKSVFCYLGTQQSASGSLNVSVSFDGTSFFLYKTTGSFYSGSLAGITFTDVVKAVSGSLNNNATSVASGSFYVLGQTL